MISLKTDRYVADDLERHELSRPAIRLNGWPLLLPALIVLLWHIAAVERWMPEQILPAPAVVADTALSLLSGDLLAQWGFSLQHLAVGLLLGVAAGTLLGALFGLVPAAAQRVEPLFLCPGADPHPRLDPAVYGAVWHR